MAESTADAAEQRELSLALGKVIRSMRRDAGKTLQQLADASGLSQPYLSQTETGRSMPSVMTLHRIATALGTTSSALLALTEPPIAPVVRLEEDSYDLDTKVQVWFRGPAERHIEQHEIVAPPLGRAGGHAAHAGGEFIHVLEGRIRVVVGTEDAYVLGVGDSLYYAATLAHEWFNDTPKAARFVQVANSPAG
ncbi:helix-turn-helix domain-containing protein [Subtercola endophyticus]|uniref:helix-turn-helix domain-containing protein n=1 Tax=Subtercola endophyticus TaxID=2895559 RepID=UPI001E4C0449|nr:XRE family transcriptional regulator [Subtercola endophyticus]UFS59033.1 XRE family transcriptional regulator [Subtercola endophyticus]